MKKWVALLVIIIVLGVLVLTCPDKEVHKEAIKEDMAEMVNEKFANDSIMGMSGFGVSGIAFVKGMASMVLDTNLRVRNYFIFSLGEISYDGEKRIVSIGIMGHAFTVFRKNFQLK